MFPFYTPGVFRGFKMGTSARNGLISFYSPLELSEDIQNFATFEAKFCDDPLLSTLNMFLQAWLIVKWFKW